MTQYTFQRDWFSSTIPEWEMTLSPLRGKPNLAFLEIGSFEGRSAVWLLENILTDQTSTLTCVDTWSGSAEHESTSLHFDQVESNFDRNIRVTGSGTQVIKVKNFSYKVLPHLKPDSYDFIYIDGSHKASDVLEDAVLSWRLLKRDGIIIFDDYVWEPQYSELESPKIGVDAFVKCYQDQITIIRESMQYTIQKK